MPRKRKKMCDVAGNEIAGYRFGPYWFQVTGKGTISGLCGGSFSSEVELIDAYDKTYGKHAGNPPLIRVYAEGAEFLLRGELPNAA
jgi:hypothetical protein